MKYQILSLPLVLFFSTGCSSTPQLSSSPDPVPLASNHENGPSRSPAAKGIPVIHDHKRAFAPQPGTFIRGQDVKVSYQGQPEKPESASETIEKFVSGKLVSVGPKYLTVKTEEGRKVQLSRWLINWINLNLVQNKGTLERAQKLAKSPLVDWGQKVIEVDFKDETQNHGVFKMDTEERKAALLNLSGKVVMAATDKQRYPIVGIVESVDNGQLVLKVGDSSTKFFWREIRDLYLPF